MGRRQTVAWSGFRREQGRGSIPTLIPLYWLEGVPFREKTVGDFRIGAELHPGAIVDLEKPICSGLMKPDTHLGENARQIEVSDD